ATLFRSIGGVTWSVSELGLAAGSPRRKELLQLLDRPFTVVQPDVPEQRFEQEAPADYVQRLALSKARAGATMVGAQCTVLGADTIVVFTDNVLEKPRDYADYVRMMRQLSGHTHHVMTAVAAVKGGQEECILSGAEVSFKALTDAEIEQYWHTKEPIDKAGGYGIQGRAAKFVTGIVGSYWAVVGLPIYETEQLIQTIEG